jgi:hypothetical protein
MQHLLTMMRTTAVKMLFVLVLNQDIKLIRSFSLEMTSFHLRLPRTERDCWRQHTKRHCGRKHEFLASASPKATMKNVPPRKKVRSYQGNNAVAAPASLQHKKIYTRGMIPASNEVLQFGNNWEVFYGLCSSVVWEEQLDELSEIESDYTARHGLV